MKGKRLRRIFSDPRPNLMLQFSSSTVRFLSRCINKLAEQRGQVTTMMGVLLGRGPGIVAGQL